MAILKYLLTGLFLCTSLSTQAQRVKDISSIAGVRDNQLVGYGLVVGLNGTGDKTGQAPFTAQSFKTMLTRLGVRVPEGTNITIKNVAAVLIHADLPPFAKPGQEIDVTVSSIGDATSLRGGNLLMAPLKGADGQTYAIAQGSLVVSGIGAQGSDGSKITVNVPSVGRIPNGAIVERMVAMPYINNHTMMLHLDRPDFTTAKRIEDAIDKLAWHGHGPNKNNAQALDAATIQVKLPQDYQQQVAYIAKLENLNVRPGDAAARIIINSRTGTIVIGQHVLVKPAAVSHGNLSVTISENTFVSQPPPLSAGGETVKVAQSDIKVQQEKKRAFVFAPGITLNDLVRTINSVGAAPGDLVAILEALKSVGALEAKLEII